MLHSVELYSRLRLSARSLDPAVLDEESEHVYTLYSPNDVNVIRSSGVVVTEIEEFYIRGLHSSI